MLDPGVERGGLKARRGGPPLSGLESGFCGSLGTSEYQISIRGGGVLGGDLSAPFWEPAGLFAGTVVGT